MNQENAYSKGCKVKHPGLAEINAPVGPQEVDAATP